MPQWRPSVNLSRRNDLCPNEPLLDSDDATTYCSPDKYDAESCEPEVAAFQQADSKSGVSINRLHHYLFGRREQAVDMIRQEFKNEPYDLREEGRFVLFNIKTARHALDRAGFSGVSFIFTPTPTRESHADIENLPTDHSESRHVAATIKRAVTHTYAALH